MTPEQEFPYALETEIPLADMLDWINSNLPLERVFAADILMEWASCKSPENIFPEWELEEWALKNDFNRE